MIVECVTDNINRTVAEIRVAFRKGQLGASGSVAWDFNHVGLIEASPDSPDADPEMAAIEAGAQDFEEGEEEGTTLFITETTDLDFAKVAEDTVLDAPTWTASNLAAGEYLVRIQVLDASGLESDFSPPRKIRVGTGIRTGAGLPVSTSSGTPVGRP